MSLAGHSERLAQGGMIASVRQCARRMAPWAHARVFGTIPSLSPVPCRSRPSCGSVALKVARGNILTAIQKANPFRSGRWMPTPSDTDAHAALAAPWSARRRKGPRCADGGIAGGGLTGANFAPKLIFLIRDRAAPGNSSAIDLTRSQRAAALRKMRSPSKNNRARLPARAASVAKNAQSED